MDAYGGSDDSDELSPVRARHTRKAAPKETPATSVLGWAALFASLIATFFTLAAITPIVMPRLAPLGPDIVYAFAVVWFWPFVLFGIGLDVVAGWRGGNNRRMAIGGGIVMAIAGAYALSALGIIVAEI